MKVFKYSLVAIFAVAVTGTAARASTITFNTPSGATTGGGPVNDTATLTTGAGTVSVSLTNLQANPTDVAQLLSDLFFTLNGGNTAGGTLGTTNASFINVAGNGTTTPAGSGATGWTLDTSGGSANGGTLHLCVICGGGAGPANLIIGPPNGSGIYANANGSIAGNGPHNPFINQTATFTVNVPGVTANTLITGAVFSFGTTAGINVPGVPNLPLNPVPEPATLALFGTGLAYLSTRIRRRR